MNLDFVPQVFYDLLARVVPGFVLLIGWYFTILSPSRAVEEIVNFIPNQGGLNFWVSSILLVMAYVFGFILNGVWSMTFAKLKQRISKSQHKEIYTSCISEYNNIRKQHGKPKIQITEKEIPPTHVMHDHLRHYSASEAYRLLKLQAESRLSEGIFIGCVLLPLVNLFLLASNTNILVVERVGLEIILLIGLVVFWRNALRYDKYYINGICTSWLFSNFPVESGKAKKKSSS